MLGIPILWSALAILLAGAVGLGSGWHYGGKVVRADLDAAVAANARLRSDLDGVRRDCADAITKLKADAERRRKGADSAAKAAAEREASQRGLIDSLALQAATAQDSAQNCENAQAILGRLAKDKR